MRRCLIILLSFFIFGCLSKPQGKTPVLAKINNYEISKQEFEEDFKESSFARTNTLDSKKEFLDSLINRKLIMQEAQRQGLDKNPNFLRMIERFWEQSLLKQALEQRSIEIAGSVIVNDKEVEEAYKQMLAEGKTNKPYEQVYDQLKWELARNKQSRALNNWVFKLRKRAKISVDYELLKK
jgi:hypothetical protein